MLLQMALFHSFLWLSSIPLYIFTTSSLSIHPFINVHLGFFYVLAIVNSAAIYIGVHVSFLNYDFVWICPGVGLLDHMATLFLVF